MEAYDISNIQGKAAVGSMVVFEGGRSKPAHYRRFRIKTVAGADDYAMLREVVGRRFRHARRETTTTDGWAIVPDLVLIDGGRGQLNAALAAMREAGVNSVPVASIAKENEEIFVPQQARPVILPRSSPGLQLLERLRDEAHRFAITYFKRVYKKQTFTSAFDGVPGIGPRRRRTLLKQFGSVRAIKEASVAELAATKGMTENLAIKVKESL
jgi:excinuclease ABC subunit C